MENLNTDQVFYDILELLLIFLGVIMNAIMLFKKMILLKNFFVFS